MGNRLAREVYVAVREMRDPADVVRPVDEVADFDHSEVPVGFNDAVEIDQRQRDHPVCHRWRIREERKEFELNTIEAVDGYGCFRVAVQVLVELLKYCVDSVRCFRIR